MVVEVRGMLEAELETYERNKSDLLAHARGKWVLVHDDAIVGTFDTQLDATYQGYRQFGDEPFLVRQVEEIETVENLVIYVA